MQRILKWPWVVIGIIAIITIFFAFQLPNIKINNAVKIFLPEDHPAKVANNKMEDIYGSSDIIGLAIKSKKGDLLNQQNIKEISQITKSLEEIVNVDEVTSITNADYISGTSKGMKVEELVEELPKSQSDIYDLKEKLLAWDLYRGNLYSDDLASTQIRVQLKKGLAIEEKEEVYNNIKNKLKKYNKHDFEFYLAGSPAVNVLMGNNMESDLRRLVPFVIAVVLIVLYLSFKNIGGVILPMLTVSISTIWALGIMALLGIELTMVSTVIPVLLVAVGSAYGIHIISHYYDDLRKESKHNLTEEKHREIVFKTVKKVGKPVLLAGLTTIVGFSSLATSSIIPIKEFGIFTAIGVFTALIVALTLIPAILLAQHGNLEYNEEEKEDSIINGVLMKLYSYFSGARVRVLVLAIIIMIASLYGISKVVIDNVMIEMFREDTEIRKADQFINQNFSGTNILNVMIDGPNDGSLTNPEVLKEMDNLNKYLINKYDQVGKVTSVADFIKRMNQVMHYPEEETEDTNQSQTEDLSENETTSDFGQETTSSFGEENTSDFGSETTSDFSEETTSDFGSSSKEKESESANEEVKNLAPSTKKMSEKEVIKLLNKAVVRAEKLDLTGEELVDAVSKELNYMGAAYNEVPYHPEKYPAQNREQLKNLVSQYLLMYSGSLDDLINEQLEPSKGRMMVQIKTGSNIVIKKIKKDIQNYIEHYFPDGYEVSMAGYADMSLAVNNLIVSSQIMSILVSLVVVFLIVAVTYRSVIAGLYGIIPLGISLLINFGIMGYTGIKLDIGTAMVASIAIGIGVDYTIHFLSAYHYERQRSEDLEEVCQNTILTAGKAIIFNAASVAAGFAVLLFSNFYPLVNLGLLVMLTMITSSIASMTILPALLNLFQPDFISK
ncbi:efflux RND transporter permease subunit [Halanaerobacter jeridensis]|uniref:RND superfamily exporter protein n=1 Tax=Halanaerobacter jeridensis TaxID=706427 RepID=A0A939BNI0_9FIRM|nr:MMPL family transporter [Halanaerobacter jeridensis]MBM7555278.1 putative RND superfamily exporter protein [Halanaerobacter jeridensis]